jgi:hypothetical protein
MSMAGPDENETEPEALGEGRLFSWKRIKTIVIGSVVALVVGVGAVFVYTSIQYGGTPLDRFFKRKQPAPPMAGWLAYEKDSDRFIGVIRSEGFSNKRGVDVYYIERPGGQLIEFPKSLVSARAPEKK